MVDDREPSDEEVDDLAQQLIHMDDRADLEQAVQSGRVMLDKVFDGDAASFDLSGLPREQLEYLARAANVTAEDFSRWMDIFIVQHRLGGLQRFSNLGIRHFAVVLALPEAEQEAFLTNAQRERWTVEQLAREITSAGWPRPTVPQPRPR